MFTTLSINGRRLHNIITPRKINLNSKNYRIIGSHSTTTSCLFDQLPPESIFQSSSYLSAILFTGYVKATLEWVAVAPLYLPVAKSVEVVVIFKRMITLIQSFVCFTTITTVSTNRHWLQHMELYFHLSHLLCYLSLLVHYLSVATLTAESRSPVNSLHIDSRARVYLISVNWIPCFLHEPHCVYWD